MEKVEELRAGQFEEERTHVSEALFLDCFLCGKSIYVLQAYRVEPSDNAGRILGPAVYAHRHCINEKRDVLWVLYERTVRGIVDNVAPL